MAVAHQFKLLHTCLEVLLAPENLGETNDFFKGNAPACFFQTLPNEPCQCES